MTYATAIERIAYKWDKANKTVANEADEAFTDGHISGMIEMLAMMECEPKWKVRNDVIDEGQKHGMLLNEMKAEVE